MVRSEASEPLVYTVAQAAKLLQVSENTLYGLIAQGLVPHTRWGKLIRIPRWALVQELASQSGVPAPLEIELAHGATQSVHQRQHDEEDDDG